MGEVPRTASWVMFTNIQPSLPDWFVFSKSYPGLASWAPRLHTQPLLRGCFESSLHNCQGMSRMTSGPGGGLWRERLAKQFGGAPATQRLRSL